MNNPTSSPGSPRFPTFSRFFRWFFSRRTLGSLLVGLAALATLITLVCTEENWRGKRAWQKYARQLEAQGEKLDWKDYVAPPVPDEQNFAMTPFLAPLYDWNPPPFLPDQSRWRDTNGFNRINTFQREIGTLEDSVPERSPYRLLHQMTDLQTWALTLTGKTNKGAAAAGPALTRAEAAAIVLRGLEKFDPIVDELRKASQRPYARFNIHYDADIATAILLPHLACLRAATVLFQVRGSAEVALGRTDQAWADTRMALYLADTLKDEPFLISKLLQVSLVQRSLRPIWEGLAERRWSDAQLVEIEQRLGKINLLADAAMRGERAMDILTANQMRDQERLDPEDSSNRIPGLGSLFLGGFFYQNKLFMTRMFQQYFVPVVDAASQRVYPSRAVTNDAAMAAEIAGGLRPYHLFARLLMPGIADPEMKFAFAQTRVNQAIVGCALERYRLAQGQFPESLEPLSPRFVEKLPHDIITGAPLIFRRAPDSQFVLYSVGWDEKDDGGTVGWAGYKGRNSDLIPVNDWVWQYPAPAAAPVQNAPRE